VKAAEFVRCNQIFGVHFDTFPPIKINHAVAKEKFKAAGKPCTCCIRRDARFLIASVVRIHDVQVNAGCVVHEKFDDIGRVNCTNAVPLYRVPQG